MNKIISLLIKALSICLLIYFLIGISEGIYENKKDIALMKKKIDANEKINNDLMVVEKNMVQRINNLKDPREIEKIAREGRKFGINLVISSQRPSEISKTVVSQCNSFIIHKITNKQDFEIITR